MSGRQAESQIRHDRAHTSRHLLPRMLHAKRSGNKSASDEMRSKDAFCLLDDMPTDAKVEIMHASQYARRKYHRQCFSPTPRRYKTARQVSNKKDRLQGAHHSAKFRRESRFGSASEATGRRAGIQRGVQRKQTSQSVQLSALQPIGNRRLSERPAAASAEADSAELRW